MNALLRNLSASIVMVTAAQAQPAVSPPPPAPLPVTVPIPMQAPLPPNGCVWAGRTYSDGATFCMGAHTQIMCKVGKWDTSNTEACRAANPIDSR
jgi:hypothetical protein